MVVPAWNEQECVARTLGEIRTAVPDVDLVVVDDGSTDTTAQCARAVGVDVIELPYNLGVGGAVRAGFRYAVRHDYDAVVQVDADGQHDPKEIPRLLERLSDADLVIGARFAERGDYVVRGPRRWAVVLLAKILSAIVGERLTDTTSGFRASGRAATELFSMNYPVEYLGDTVESLVIAARSGCKVAQVPVRMRTRQAGVPSHRPGKAAIYLLRANLALAVALVRRRSPVPLAEERSAL